MPETKNKQTYLISGIIIAVVLIGATAGYLYYMNMPKTWSCKQVLFDIPAKADGAAEGLKFHVMGCTKNKTRESITAGYDPQSGLMPHQVKKWKVVSYDSETDERLIGDYSGDMPLECIQTRSKENSKGASTVLNSWACD